MEIKNLNKATKTFKLLQEVDAEIIKIEKIAMLCASGDSKIKFELSVTEKEKAKKESVLDSDGSLINGNEPRLSFSLLYSNPFDFGKPTIKEDNSHKLKYDLTDITSLEVLAVILADKQKFRTSLIKRLEKLGFK